MRYRFLFAIPLSAILAVLALLHAYWALGGRWGSSVTIPTIDGRKSFSPSPLATWVVCGLLAAATLLAIGKAGWIETGSLTWLFDLGVWVLACVFLLRAIGDLRTFGFFKAVTDTPFARWDTRLYSPLCLLLALLAAGLAALPRAR